MYVEDMKEEMGQIYDSASAGNWAPARSCHFSILTSKSVAGPVLHSHYFAGETGSLSTKISS